MKTLMHTLYLALVISLGPAIAGSQSHYGDFSFDTTQAFHAYLNGLEAIKIEGDPGFRQAIEAVPINLGTLIDHKQEVGLHDWLYDFLVAFSPSGSDSLAAMFYLREGVDNFNLMTALPNLTKLPNIEKLKFGGSTGVTPTPFPFFKNMHRLVLNGLDRSYFFTNVSLSNSSFEVFETQEKYDSHVSYAQTHSVVPNGTIDFKFKRRREVENRLRAGEKMIFADIMFIVKELPLEHSTLKTPESTLFFFRLMWDTEQATWCHVEALCSMGMPYVFLFGLI